jgi:hypothetical protein
VRQWVDELTGAVLSHDAAGFVYFPVDDGGPVQVAFGTWAREIVPAIREAVARR